MLLAASVAATIFNVLVIFCATKIFRRSGDTMHLFIISMTIGDLLLTGDKVTVNYIKKARFWLIKLKKAG